MQVTESLEQNKTEEQKLQKSRYIVYRLFRIKSIL